MAEYYSPRQARRRAGLTQKDVQRNTGIAPTVLSLIERGRTSPQERTRLTLECLYGCRVNWLDVKIEPKPMVGPVEWIDCERRFRYLLRLINDLPEDEKVIFVNTIIQHLKHSLK